MGDGPVCIGRWSIRSSIHFTQRITLLINFNLRQHEVVKKLQFTWASDHTALALKFVYGPYLALTILIC
jgi:hypothetical protein